MSDKHATSPDPSSVREQYEWDTQDGKPPQCEANVWMRPGYWHKFQCKRKATREVDRLPLCTQHAKLAEAKGIRYVQ